MKAIAVILACLVVVALAAPAKRLSATGAVTISFSGNVTLTNSTQSQTLGYRAVKAKVVAFDLNLGGLANFYFNGFFSSAAQATLAPYQATLDEVAGGFFVSNGFYPEGFFAWFDATGKWTGPVSGTSPASIISGLTASGGLIGTAFIGVTEYDTNNSPVNTVDFSKISFSQAAVSAAVSFSTQAALTDTTGNVQYSWFAATSGQATYNFTALHSAVLGKLNYGATVTPKSGSIILEIDNYQYVTATNHLNLTYVTAFVYSGFNGAAAVSGVNNVVAGLGANQIWVSTSTSATVSGNSQSVGISITTNVYSNIPTAYANALQSVSTYLQNAFPGATIGAAVIQVQFPAGSEQIIYDPTSGFEQPQTNASTAVRSSALAVLVASVLAFFFGSNL